MAKFIILLLIGFSNYLIAQNKSENNIIDKLQNAKLYKNMIINFDFENKYEKINESGTLLFNENGFQLKIQDQTIINNGETQWIYLSKINEVQIIKNDPEEWLMNPNNLFSFDQENYRYNYIGKTTEGGKSLEIVELFPKEKKSFAKINITINTKNNQIEKISIYDNNEWVYRYLIKSIKSNKKNTNFTFDPNDYEDIEIIDLRELSD